MLTSVYSYPRPEAHEILTKNVWLKGHTGEQSNKKNEFSSIADPDFGNVTILYSQPIGGLQILSSDNKWRWIKHIDNALASESLRSYPLWTQRAFRR